MQSTVSSFNPASLAGAESSVKARLVSLDAYRGFVMLLMMAEVLSFAEVSAALPASNFWRFLGSQQSHSEWIGCTLHDLIQPSFSFLVGVALPFSLARRKAQGQSRLKRAGHAAWRSLVLILLGVALRSVGRSQTYWTFEDTLTQIGLGYFFLYFLAGRPSRDHWIAFTLILAIYWAAFAWFPAPGPNFDPEKVGVPRGWPFWLNGFAAHWNKNSNLAWAFDVWFLNLFSCEHPFLFNEGGYATLSFVPTLATMILGLVAGGILRDSREPGAKVKWFAVAGALGIAGGLALGALGICPVVKRIWTPSWVLFSGGWCFWILGGFYLLLDIGRRRSWAIPLVVIGMNSIAAYCMAHLFTPFIESTLQTHLGSRAFAVLGDAYAPFLRGVAVLLILWLILWWMRRRSIFLKI